MKKTISFVVVLAMILSLAMTVLPVSAAYNAITTSTEDPSATYAVGASVRLWANSVYAQSFEANADIVGISFGCWEGGSGANVEVSFYAYDTDITTSIAGTAALTTTVNAEQGQNASAVIELPSTLPAGKYVIKLALALDQGFHMAQGTAAEGAEIYVSEVTGLATGNAVIMAIYTEASTDAPITNASQISSGETVLTQDISGALNVTSGTYVIDLAGHTWSHNNVALTVGGTADVTVKDSVGGGKIAVRPNDATQVDGGKLTLDNVTVSADGGGMDAIFVNAGTVIVKNSTLIATKAGIDVSQNGDSATIVVDGATFGVYKGAEDPSRSCAIEFRNSNKDIELKGDIKFENNLILRRDVGTETPSDVASLFDFGEGSSAKFSEAGEVIEGRWTPNTIEYSYEAPKTPVDPEEPVKDKNVLYVSYDEIKPGILCGGKDENIKTPVLEAGTKEATFWGWVALAKNIKSFSYSINGGEKVDQPAAVIAAEQPVLDAVANVEGAVTGSRFQVVVPVTDGTQTIEIFAEFEDGTSESFWKADLTVGEPTGDVETGDFMSFAFVIAAAAVVVTVLSKKRAF